MFAPGYRLAPYTYTQLLRAWARAGYVVASPYFPLTNADARVVDRSDLINQPQDLRFVIARLMSSRSALLQGLIDRNRIALGGHSDGVDSALAIVYSQRRDPRIRAALGFSGAEVAAFTGFPSAPRGIPLLTIQGTADSVNSPGGTYAYFHAAPPAEVPAEAAWRRIETADLRIGIRSSRRERRRDGVRVMRVPGIEVPVGDSQMIHDSS